ncbi:TetR/AcrR family transcriptional regulator [Streptomyces sp. WM6386]|uniref:TetR/AcrR family transcriptional regulator n=1 Tax=Streptomyces sp. WM6386 TaxID=1415558 RepID=UPI00061933E3|nr:TetR/AcrR family transcriptional regulator [Streptomyces sp. WM6386]KKD06671.1 TetR family transcriptional regulator [Streptomyces sp. WM6386]
MPALSHPVRRTRLAPERERELYEAVMALVCEVGYDALTMDAVATRAQASKATLYRQWNGKPELVATALRETKAVLVGEVDTGSLPGDLREIVRRIGDHSAQNVSVMRGIGQAVERNPELGRALRESLIEPEVQALRRILARAVARGELDENQPATAFLPQAMLGAVVARPLLEDRPADAAYLTRFVDEMVLPALGL